MFFRDSKNRRQPVRIQETASYIPPLRVGDADKIHAGSISAERWPRMNTVAEMAATERRSIKERLDIRRGELLEQKKQVEQELAMTELEIQAAEAAEKIVGKVSVSEDELAEALEKVNLGLGEGNRDDE